MAFSSQIFKAPTFKTTPKLKKTMVSSSVFSGVKSANIAKVNYGGLAKAIGSQPKSIDVEKISAPLESPLAGIVSDLQKDVLDLKKSFVKLEERDSTGSKDQLKIQKSFEILVTSLNNTGVVLNQITDYLVTESKLEQQLLKKKDREEKKEEDRLKKEKKEKSLEKDGRGLKKALLRPVSFVAGKAKNIFDTFKEVLTLLFFGWLTDKGFLAIELWKKKDEEGLQNLAGEVGKAILGFGSLMLLMTGGIFSVIGAIGAGISATLGIGPTIRNFFRGFRGQVPPKPNEGGGGGSGQVGGRMSGGSNTGLYYGKGVDPKTGKPMRSPGSISRYNASYARSLQGKANFGDKARLGFSDIKSKFNNLMGGKSSTSSVPAKPAGSVASSRRLFQGARGLRNIARPGAASLLFAGFDYASRTNAGQTQTQAITGTAAGATGGILGGIGGKLGGTAAGGVAGAVIGGILGSVIPGAGTLAGAALGAKLGSSLGGLAGMFYGGYKGSEAAAKIADGMTGADKTHAELDPERRKKKTKSIFPDPADAISFKPEHYLLGIDTTKQSLTWIKDFNTPKPFEPFEIDRSQKARERAQQLTGSGRPDPFAPVIPDIPSNNPIPPAPSVEEEPEVIIQRISRPAPSTDANPVSGSEVPNISSSNPNNFYTMYSKVQYNVVA